LLMPSPPISTPHEPALGFYADALGQFRQWLTAEGGARTIERLLNSDLAAEGDGPPHPVGKAEREAATALWRQGYQEIRSIGNDELASWWLRQGARIDILPETLTNPAAEAVLKARDGLGPYRRAALRWLRGSTLRPEGRAQLQARLREELPSTPTSPPDQALRVLKLANSLRGVRGFSGAADHAAAAALCALDRGAHAAPLLQALAASGTWPDELRPLLAYGYFAAGDWKQGAVLAELWPEDPGKLGPAEPGARLRCALCLIRVNERAAAAAMLGPLVERYGWICRGALAVLAAASAPEAAPSQLHQRVARSLRLKRHRPSITYPPEEEPFPEEWLASFWRAAVSVAGGAYLSATELPGLDGSGSQTERRWALELAGCCLRRLLERREWANAHALAAAERGRLLLPEWQQVILAGLAGIRPAPSPDLLTWLWTRLPEETNECLLGALVGALAGAPDGLRLAARAKLARKDPAAADLARIWIKSAGPELVRAGRAAGAPDSAWSELVEEATQEAERADLQALVERVVADTSMEWRVPGPPLPVPFDDDDLRRWEPRGTPD
jgi:hypothetical protein